MLEGAKYHPGQLFLSAFPGRVRKKQTGCSANRVLRVTESCWEVGARRAANYLLELGKVEDESGDAVGRGVSPNREDGMGQGRMLLCGKISRNGKSWHDPFMVFQWIFTP